MDILEKRSIFVDLVVLELLPLLAYWNLSKGILVPFHDPLYQLQTTSGVFLV